MLGIMPGHIYLQGNVGVISRSGTLGYEAASQLKELGLGISTSVGIGGDPINGSSFLDHLALFETDPDTEAVLMIGEIGGPQEAEASAWIRENMSKPVIGFVAGLTAPKGRRMGHAGAIISAAGDSAAEKAEIMRSYRSHGGAGSGQLRSDGGRRAGPGGVAASQPSPVRGRGPRGGGAGEGQRDGAGFGSRRDLSGQGAPLSRPLLTQWPPVPAEGKGGCVAPTPGSTLCHEVAL